MDRKSGLLLARPSMVPPLSVDFWPISLGNIRYMEAVHASGNGVPLRIALERNDGCVSAFRTDIFSPGSEHDTETLLYVERLVKFLLWQRGGWKLIVGGPIEIGNHIRHVYSFRGPRAFDVELMERAYERPFVVETMPASEVAKSRESSTTLGGYLDGCRIGFDLGASDYKVAAVVNGNPVFTMELPWDPKIEPDPEFHYKKISEGLKLAASHLPRVDAIGGSSAGILINNQIMVASLFRAVPREIFDQQVKPIFLRLQKEWHVPLEVANDGDVTALAGAMSLNATSLLGIAMGSSQAAGYLNGSGHMTGWLNELAFAPVDYNPQAPADEWSGDIGCGSQYFSQQAVVRLAPKAGIELPAGHPAEQLKFIQDLHEKGDVRADKIYETIGVHLGYALAQYVSMYGCQHVLILGRVTSGAGGGVILRKAREVLKADFPEVNQTLSLHLPDEKSKRVGQAVAAASLPKLKT